MIKKVLFLTGTRADFGKQKTLMQAVKDHPAFDLQIFCTGMHMMEKYGHTAVEIVKAGFGKEIFYFLNQVEGESMEIILSNTIAGLSRFLHENSVDLIVIHGDRIEALSGAIVGALRNTLVSHIEGGEVSGTIDDLIRHSTSKLAHIHFVANNKASQRLEQLGEISSNIFNIGSPDVDVMLSKGLPSLPQVAERYELKFKEYSIAMLHPVTTEVTRMSENVHIFVDSLINSNKNYIVIYPNNDLGSEFIFEAYKRLENHERFQIFPSVRFEYFLTLLKHAEFLIGNSSAGIHEAPVYGVPTIDIGSRQKNRFVADSIKNIDFDEELILNTIKWAAENERFPPTEHYGTGNSAQQFLEIIAKNQFWATEKQKKFVDLNFLS